MHLHALAPALHTDSIWYRNHRWQQQIWHKCGKATTKNVGKNPPEWEKSSAQHLLCNIYLCCFYAKICLLLSIFLPLSRWFVSLHFPCIFISLIVRQTPCVSQSQCMTRLTYFLFCVSFFVPPFVLPASLAVIILTFPCIKIERVLININRLATMAMHHWQRRRLKNRTGARNVGENVDDKKKYDTLPGELRNFQNTRFAAN